MKHLLILAVIFFIVVFGFLVQNIQREEHFNLAKREILLRKIGHEILLHSGDSSSHVLPVTKMPGDKYLLRFENRFAFDPDSLVKIVRRTLIQNQQKPDYILNVLNCQDMEVVYGYTVSDSEKNEIVPCKGRAYPADCYKIAFYFRDSGTGIKKYLATGSLLAIVILFPVIVFHYRSKKTLPVKSAKNTNPQLLIGSILFDKDKKCLITATETINLTAKEIKLLSIFAQSPNQIIDRSRLQKEIWEDDGIIVGRSLDVFISKLRKKLESDASVQLINIHGKGYKLQIDNLVD